MNRRHDVKGGPKYVYAGTQMEDPPVAYTLEIAPEVFADFLTSGVLYGVEIPHEGLDQHALLAKAAISTLGPRRRLIEEERKGDDEPIWDSD